MYVAVDPADWRTMFTSAENGSFFRYDPLTHNINRISPIPESVINYETAIPDSLKGTGREWRYNWEGPLRMSSHDAKTLYAGANYLFKTRDQGLSWEIISPDLSTNDPVKSEMGKSGGITPDNSGAETHCAITTISPSSLDPAIIWVGTDDGNVQITRDGGKSWKNVRSAVPEVPAGIWVSRLEASHFDRARAYLTFDGHRSDRNRPWVFKTDDFGATWTDIGSTLPADEVVRVIREDLKNPNLLFIGTETGIFFSIDGGSKWDRFMTALPTVSVYDLKIHPRENDLVAGTHGRSIWIADDITPLQQLDDQVLNSSAWLFEQRVATLWENTSRGGQRGHFWFAGENPPTIKNTSNVPRAEFSNGAIINYYVGGYTIGPLELEISERSGDQKRVVELENTQGIHRYIWDGEFDALPYTADEAARIEAAFQDLLSRYNYNRLRQAYAGYQLAKTPLDQRRIIQGLQRGFMRFPIKEDLGVPAAGPGSYILKLKMGGKVLMTRSLHLREDPLGDH